jgi:pilus assembly protein CpaB
MMTNRRRNNAIAILLAAIAAALAAMYASGGSSKAAGPSAQQVLVATEDIAAGTPGTALLAQHLVAKRSLAPAAVVSGALKDSTRLSGLVSIQPIRAGQQLNGHQFASGSGDGSAAAALRGSERVITVAGTGDQLLAGVVQPGDHVDVVASIAYPQGSSSRYSRIILRNLLVLKAPAKSSSSGISSAAHDVTATLALDDSQAQALFYVLKNSDWSLLLRPAAQAANGETKSFTAATLLGWNR